MSLFKLFSTDDLFRKRLNEKSTPCCMKCLVNLNFFLFTYKIAQGDMKYEVKQQNKLMTVWKSTHIRILYWLNSRMTSPIVSYI